MTKRNTAARKLIYSLITLLDCLPLTLKLLPYHFTFKITQKALESDDVKVWAKNSYYTQNITFPLSDIDVVVYTSSEKQIPEICKTIRFFKKIFPLLGEFSLLAPQAVQNYSSLLNFYELNRDPLFKKQLAPTTSQRSPTDAQKFVFISRMLLSDRDNLLLWPSLRLRKWNKHFQDVGENTPTRSCEIISQVCKEILGPISHSDILPLTMAIIQTDQDSTQAIQSLHQDIEEEKVCLFAAMAPSLWLGSSIALCSMEKDLENIQKSPKIIQDILQEQIRWEIWGISTQIYRLEGDRENLSRHLSHLEKTLHSLTATEAGMEETQNALTELHRQVSSL